MKYLAFIRHSEKHRDTPPPPALREAMGKFVEKSMKDGTLVDTGGLAHTREGTRITIRGGELTVTDGPFTESREVIGGWAIMQGTREQVMRTATEFMELHRKHWPGFDCESELRPMEGGVEGG